MERETLPFCARLDARYPIVLLRSSASSWIRKSSLLTFSSSAPSLCRSTTGVGLENVCRSVGEAGLEGSLASPSCSGALGPACSKKIARHRGHVLLEIHLEMQIFPKMCPQGRRTGSSESFLFSKASLQIWQVLCSSGSSLIEITGSDSRSARLGFAVDGDLRVADPKLLIGMTLEHAVFGLPTPPMLPMLMYAAVRDAKGQKVCAEINDLKPVSDSRLPSPLLGGDLEITSEWLVL